MLMLLLKSFVCAIVTLGVIYGGIKLFSKLNDLEQTYVCWALLVIIFTLCFFYAFVGYNYYL